VSKIGWPAAVVATLIALGLVIVELTDAAQRRWWAARPLTTDTVSGLLVLLITVLVVNQLLNRRQARHELNDAVKQLQTAAAPLLPLLSPETRDSIQRIGGTAEE
jgi:TRAP-type C4-dicarboxylate transport system permease large subunit